MKKSLINELTREQERELVEFRERMWRQGTSSLPLDRAMAEKAISDAYAIVNRPAPKFFWMPSPASCALALYVLEKLAEDAQRPAGKELKKLRAGLRDGLWAGLGDGLGAGLRDGLRDGLWAGLGDGLGDGLWAGLGDGLGDGLWAGLGDGLWDGLRDGLWAGLRDGLWAGLRAGLRDGLWDGLGAGLRDGLRDGLEDGLRDGLGARLGAGLRDGLWAGLRDGLGAGLRAGLRDGLWAGLGDGLWAGLGDGLWAGLRAGLRQQVPHRSYWPGQMDTYWLAYYRFGSMIGCPQRESLLERLDTMERIAASCGFWWPRDGICIVSDRFAGVNWDNSRNAVGLPFRLHHDTKQAVAFRDGWGLFYWHGFRIPPTHEWLFTDRAKLSADAIDKEPNVELRRIMLEIYGFDRYCAERTAKVISADELHGQPRRLLEVTIKGEPIRIVEVVNGSLEPDGTRRKFHLGSMRGETPADVIAASYGIATTHYREAVRT